MKTKIVGICICFMLLTTVFAVAQPGQQQKTSSQPTQAASTPLIDVPVWELGDSWTYQINDLSFNYSSDTQSILLHASLTNLPLEVTSTAGDSYTLSFTTTMNGTGYINANPGDGPVNISVIISNLAIYGTVQVQKSNLGIKNITLSFDNQKITFNLNEQPYIHLPTWLHKISAKFTTTVEVNCNYSVALFSFPFGIGDFWDLIGTDFSLNGQIQSKLFNLLNFINNIAKLFGKELLPTEIASLLPVIDFHDALTTVIGTNVFNIPTVPGVFYCLATENVSVPAGTFAAYNVTLLAGMGQCYYAPAAGNVIRLTGNFQDIIPYVKSVDMTLLHTTYS